MFRVDLSSGGGLTEGELATKRKKWSRKTEDRIERLIEKEYEDDRKAWLRYEKRVRSYYWTPFIRKRCNQNAARRFNAVTKSAQLNGYHRPSAPRHKFGVKCIRCDLTYQVPGAEYCERCLREVTPHEWPTLNRHTVYRWKQSGSLWGGDQNDPGFEDLIRLMEDG